MTRLLRANLKHFMGVKYERLYQIIFIWMLLFLTLRFAEIRIEITPMVIWLSTIFLTVGGFVQVLSSSGVINDLRGQFMLPEKKAVFHCAFFLVVATYILLTKISLIMVAYFAVSSLKISALIGFVFCFSVSGLVTYMLTFKIETTARNLPMINRSHSSFMCYLLRYLISNPKYMVNTVFLWIFGSVFSTIIGKRMTAAFLPIGLALMCFNTPLGLLLSSDHALYQQIKLLPKQLVLIIRPYLLFLLLINLIACGIFLIIWKFSGESFGGTMILIALLFSMISAFFTVALEVTFPLMNWKIESDLWHHPRKYLVPTIMIVLALLTIFLMGGF